MDMSINLILLKNPACDEHKKMIAAVKALDELGIYELPKKLAEYFHCQDTRDVDISGCLEIYNCNTHKDPTGITGVMIWDENGFEISIKDLPSGVDIIRVFNSY